jgi:hypothetical protein
VKRVVIAVALVLAAGAGCEQAGQTVSSTPVTVVRTVVVDQSPVLEAGGIGAVRLGMTLEQLQATGEIGREVTTPEFSCPVYELKAVRGWVGIENGVAVDLRVESSARTPEDLRIGASRARMHEVYPDLEQNPHGFVRVVAPATRLRFFFRDAGDTLTGMGLTGDVPGCLN